MKSKISREIIAIIIFIIVVIGILTFLMCIEHEHSEEILCSNANIQNEAKDIEVEESVQGLDFELIDTISFCGSSKVYRDKATDIMYLSRMQGMTPLIHPETRLPMNYDEYLEIYK